MTRVVGCRTLIVLTSALLLGFRCLAQETGITAAQATDIARDWVGDAQAELTRPVRAFPEHDRVARALEAWSINLRTSDGRHHGLQVDALTGTVLSWCRYRPERVDSANEPRPVITLEESREVAEKFAADKHPAFATGRWVCALGSRSKGQMSYLWGWDEVVDASSGALGPPELCVEVSDQAPEVIAFSRPPQAPITVSTRPSIGRAEMLAIARRLAILDPARFPINRLTLRVQVDDYGAQRLVWECLQVLSVDLEAGVEMYGVVHDAHTGEPLYPIAPFGGSKHRVRTVPFPRRASVKIAPGGRAMATQLAPPVVNATGLWLRAEHLRAVEGVRVDVSGETVSVRLGDRVVSGTDLGARYRDYGWWVPLRQAARVLGWRVEWLNAKKEAAIYTR